MATTIDGGHRDRLARFWSLHVVGAVDHARVIDRVRDESGWTGRYAFLIVISAGISILGLLLPSTAVLIGAMLISPLMMPIIGLGFGIATFDWVEIRRAGLALALGSLVAVALSAAFVAISPLQQVTTEIAIRTKPNLYDLLVAFLSAVAGVYALVRGRGDTVVGVAIAIALMPPLAVVGFGLATANWTVFSGSLLLFLTNLVTIALTVAAGARLYRFGAHLSPAQTRVQGALILIGLLAFAVPLGIALRQIAWESLANRQLRDAVLAPFPREARVGEIDIDFDADPIVVRAAVMTPRAVPRADAIAHARGATALGRPLDLHIDQIRVGFESGAGEAAQIAAAQATGRGTDAVAATLADRLALIAETDSIVIDAARKRATARARVLPGASAAAYRAIEARLAAGADGWRIMLVPPALPIPALDTAAEAPDVGDIAWLAVRRGDAVRVSGADADRVVAALADAGAAAVPGAASGVTRVEWASPETAPAPPR